MDEDEQLELLRKHAEEQNLAMMKFVFWGVIKLAILAAIVAFFVFWYL